MYIETKTTCPYCGVGCGVIASVDDAGKVAVRGDPDHPANFGRLCSKGSALAETLDLDGRALYPEVHGKRAGWGEALDLVAATFAETITKHGPDSAAFYVSGQLLTEDYYLANKLMKGFIGSGNIDTNSRLCMSSSVAGHRRAFGSDTVPGLYEDLELADLVVLVGSNLGWCHPVLYQRLAAAKAENPGMKVVVIDPRKTATSDIADLHLSVRPDGDAALFNGLLAYLADHGAINRRFIADHTNGFEEALAAARATNRQETLRLTGLAERELNAFYALFAASEKVVTCYSQGVNQSSIGTDKVNAIINCHLATGRIGHPGMGPFSLTGQPNAMGGREVGGLANMLAAHMSIEDAADRDRVQRFWTSPTIAAKPGLKAVDMFRAVAAGQIKALWIMSTNPVVSMPDADAVRDAIASCPFVVVSDIQKETDTARLAHVLLPATGWGEKSGTVTNSERRISRQRTFLPVPGEARPDWWQIAEVARRMGFSGFDHAAPASIFAEHAALSAFENSGQRDFDIGACAEMSPADYDCLQPFQWPRPKGRAVSETRFFADGRFYHPDGRARFIATSVAAPRRVSANFPLILNTGRVRDHWHTMTRTAKSARLSAHLAEPFAEINPDDARSLGIQDADLVRLESATGAHVIVRALLTRRQGPGSVFVPMHWTDETAACARVDALVPGITDPVSGQPASKHVAVVARRFEADRHGYVVSAMKPDALDGAYWAVAKADGGWRTELAFDKAPKDWEAWCRAHFDLPGDAESLGYSDAVNGDARLAFFAGDRLLLALFAGRGPVAVSRNWAVSQLTEAHVDTRTRFAVVAGRPGAGRPDPGATVCSCFSVGANQIIAATREGYRTVEAIGSTLSAGTNCGSCRAEIRRILDGCNAVAAE